MNAVQISEQDKIVTILLNRPKDKNAINYEVSHTIAVAMNDIGDRDDVRAVIVGSSTDGMFSAGADLIETSQGNAIYDTDGPYALWGLAGLTAKTPSVPVIAAVDGFALGGGFEIALAADILVASEAATFAFPEVKVGLMAGAGGAVRLPGQLPQKVVMDMLLTGRSMHADEAHRLGLISRFVDAGTALDVARNVAATIGQNAPLAVRGSKATVLDLEKGLEREHIARWGRNETEFAVVMNSEDALEGTTAFREKRPPSWLGY